MAEHTDHHPENDSEAEPLIPLSLAPDMPPAPRAELIGPTHVWLSGGSGRAFGPATLALTTDALWIQETRQLHRIPVQALVECVPDEGGRVLEVSASPGMADSLTLTFPTADEGLHWHRELRACRKQAADTPGNDDSPPPEGVILVGQPPDDPYTELGRVKFEASDPQAADRGLQLLAAVRGADAVVNVKRRPCPEHGLGGWSVSGMAIRLADAAARQALRWRAFTEQAKRLSTRMFVLIAVQMAVLALILLLNPFEVPTGETLLDVLVWSAVWLAAFFAWPVVLLAVLRIVPSPALLLTAGLAVLVVTAGRNLTVMAAHGFAVHAAGSPLTAKDFWLLADPVLWALTMVGVVQWNRARQLAAQSPAARTHAGGPVPTGRPVWAKALLAATLLHALGVIGIAAVARYEASSYALQPGVNPVREQEGLLAMSQGDAALDRHDLATAERSYQAAQRVWEDLTAGKHVPPVYRFNLAQTLHNLGWIRLQQGRLDEAEAYYDRAAAGWRELTRDPEFGGNARMNLVSAEQTLAEFRGDKLARALDEKAQVAIRKYEDALVKAHQAAAEAEGLCTEAIALWEEVLPQANSPDYQKLTITRLATAYLFLGDLRQQTGKVREAETAFVKAIEYGEKAVAQDPDRTLSKHNLAEARRALDEVREWSFREEINHLLAAERYAAVRDAYLRGVTEQEERLRTAADRAGTVRMLANRLERFAWFLAHCPDPAVRDTKGAITLAIRSAELEPADGGRWYTVAMAQYRDGNWRGSLASLDRVKAAAGELDASGWFLTAMNLHRSERRREARSALDRAIDWVHERRRQANEDPLLRFQYEMMRPAIDALWDEAEELIEGKTPSRGKKL